MRFREGVALDFKDVLILPKRSSLSSRSQVSLEKTYKFKNSKRSWTGIPIMVANMDTTGTFEMVKACIKHKIIVCVHKHYSIEEWKEFLLTLEDLDFNHFTVSTGIGDKDLNKLEEIIKLDSRIKFICVDVANGYSSNFINKVRLIRESYPDKILIAGNVVTGELAEELVLSGADIVKVGIGPGCFSGETKVLLADGTYRNIKDMNEGDEVINKNGEIVKVKRVMNMGYRQVIKLGLTNWYDNIYVTPDHKFLVNEEWKEIDTLTDETLTLPRNINFKIKENSVMDEELYELGVKLGMGVLNNEIKLVDLLKNNKEILEGIYDTIRENIEVQTLKSFVSLCLILGKEDLNLHNGTIRTKSLVEEEMEVFDLEIDCPTHSFIANNCVVHNSVCTTRIKTGVGYPQLSAIIETSDAAHGIGGYVIGDGGCKNPGDMSKAFGAGADFIMAGGMFAGHDESAGELVEKDGEMFKEFYGMSSDTAMKKHSGGVAKYRASEGKRVLLKYRGSIDNTLQDILGGIRSTCTYVGAHNLKELPKRTTFVQVKAQSNEVYGKN